MHVALVAGPIANSAVQGMIHGASRSGSGGTYIFYSRQWKLEIPDRLPHHLSSTNVDERSTA